MVLNILMVYTYSTDHGKCNFFVGYDVIGEPLAIMEYRLEVTQYPLTVNPLIVNRMTSLVMSRTNGNVLVFLNVVSSALNLNFSARYILVV